MRSFASDNYAGISPQAMGALQRANEGHDRAYGDDEWTQQLTVLIQEIFECECRVFLNFNGTAANALALAHLSCPYESILCHQQSHLMVDECGAPSFFSGGSTLVPLSGSMGKLDFGELEVKVREAVDVHSQHPRVVSLAQVTECGTVYTPLELERIGVFCRKHQLRFHMDGARFANAVVALNKSPADLSWRAGVDVLSLGFTKNGVALGDLVIFFDLALAKGFEFRCKQGGQLASKSRFISAPMVGLLEEGEWLKNAAHANLMAKKLSERLGAVSGVRLIYPCQANALFVGFSITTAERLYQKGWRFYRSGEIGYRLMTAWDHTEADLDLFVKDLQA